MNRITLIGRLGRDPELKYFDSGKVKGSFSIAVTRSRNKEDRSKDITDWINIEAWGKTAEIAAEYLRKGNNVGIEGKLCVDSFEKDGQKTYKTYVLADQVHLIDKKADNQINDDELPF